MARKITFVSGNKGKVEELIGLLPNDIEVDHVDIDLPELQGEHTDIVQHKCRAAAEAVGGPVVIEDVSLSITGLYGLPGPYIKTFMKKMGCYGIYDIVRRLVPDHENMDRAVANCTYAYCDGPGERVVWFVGEVKGRIVAPRATEGAFGWDPIFAPDEGGGRTYAEMSKEEKGRISHRGLAVRKLVQYLCDRHA